jgi:aspartate aminotransferase
MINMAQVIAKRAEVVHAVRHARHRRSARRHAALQRRRDDMVAVLREQGYEVHSPQATFYLIPRAPMDDDRTFCALLAEQGVAVLPGRVIELPGYFRISLTVPDETAERSLPIFARAIEQARSIVRRQP